MASPTSAPPLLGNTIGSQNDGFVIAEWQDAGVTNEMRPIAPLHMHHRDDEAWYVLEGLLGVQVGDTKVEARPGCAVFVPRGTPHTYWNAGAGLLRYLLIMTSNIHHLIQEIHAAADRSPATIRDIFRRHNSELLG
ncbi:MAG TPA: cupin domain-containing protein [Candidatus Acidoferrales bacterium]|nr:cupin domain-containing protein [Candidatus Acidoferrales bacterium]